VTALAIGIVGAGEITRRSHLPVLVNMPDVRIAWIYDHRPERASALASAHGIPAIHALAPHELPACDVALLAIPVEVRGDYLQHFANCRTAVFCEKPFAMSAAEHQRVTAAFAPHAIGCGYMRRFFQSTMLLRHIMAHNTFGPLLQLDISEGNRSKGSGADASYLDDPRLGASRGVLADLGCHGIDLALYISGADAFEVQSSTQVLDGNVDRKVTAQVDLRCSSNTGSPVEFNFGVSWLDRQDNRVRLTFSHTTVWSDLSVAGTVHVGDPQYPKEAISLSSSAAGATTYNQAFYLEWKNFLDGVRTQRESLVSARSALLTTSLVEVLLTDHGSSHA
jgi:predicted dehydrogenase